MKRNIDLKKYEKERYIEFPKRLLFHTCPYDEQKTPKLQLNSLYNFIPRERGNRRPSQWFQRCVDKIEKVSALYPLEYAELVNIRQEGIKKCPYVSIRGGLLLLVYGEHTHLTERLYAHIVSCTGINIITPPKLSRYEISFKIELEKIIQKLESTTQCHYLLECQKKFGNFYVDFYVERIAVSRRGRKQEVINKFIIEFDEKFHQQPKHRLLDSQRDQWLKTNNPDVTIIRVRHEESQLWLNNTASVGAIFPIEYGYAKFLLLATEPKRHQLIASTESVKHAYTLPISFITGLLPRKNQRLQLIRDLLTRLDIPYEDGRTSARREIVFSKKWLKKHLESYVRLNSSISVVPIKAKPHRGLI